MKRVMIKILKEIRDFFLCFLSPVAMTEIINQAESVEDLERLTDERFSLRRKAK